MTLVLAGIRKRLGTFELPALDLTVGEGEYFVLLGPSGVGKTVLLETIAGLVRPDAGTIQWCGRNITHLSPERRGIAIVYQDYALFPHMTVEHNIAYGLRSRRVPRQQAVERTHATASQLGIERLCHRSPATLSGGEQQRVALARALAIMPSLVLLDEPLSAVDLRMRRELRAELRKLHRQSGATFLHVTHDVDEALQLGQRIGVMLDARIHQVGTPEELFQHPSDAGVADFLGMRNVLPASEFDGDTCTVNGEAVHVGPHHVPFAHIWIRPEEILLSRGPFSSSARNQWKAAVVEWEFRDVLVAVRVSAGQLGLSALITYSSFRELALEAGSEVYVTFKSASVHCF